MEIRYTIDLHKVGTVAVILASMLHGSTICCKGCNGSPGFGLMSPLVVKRRRVRLKVEAEFGV